MSTITRERIEQLANGNNICKVTREERIELARKRANLPPVAKHSQTKTNQPQKEAA